MNAKLVLINGDWNEMAALDEALKSVFVNAIRIRCGWHIINRGWSRNVDGMNTYRMKMYKQQFVRMKQTIQAWMYSWMNRSVFDEDEYMISKAIFFISGISCCIEENGKKQC